MNVFLTGGTGFVGTRLIDRLVGDDRVNKIIALYRKMVPRQWDNKKIIPFYGDLCSLRNRNINESIDMVIHLAGYWKSENYRSLYRVNTEGTENVIGFCRRNNIPKVIFTSTININLRRKGAYAQTKKFAESVVQKSGINYLIFRPTLIYGKGDAGLSRIIKLVETFPIVPVLGDGKKIEQPIFIDELVDFIHQGIHSTVTDQVIEVGGRDALPFDELLKIIARSRNKDRRLFHVPIMAVLPAIKTFEFLKIPLSVTSEQVAHLDEDLRVDMTKANSLFSVHLSSFEKRIREDYD